MRDQRGFTILELLLALLLLSVVAAVSIPAWFERGEVTLEKACVLLANDLRSAQNRAAYLGEPTFFQFDPERDGYEVRDEFGDLLRNPATGEPFLRRYPRDGVFEGVDLREVRFGPDRMIVYDQHGLATEGGHVTLTFQGDSRTLFVDEGSGEITIAGSTSGWTDTGE